jgi:hypothetical protein
MARIVISFIAALGALSAEAAIGCSPAKLTQTTSETKAMARKAFHSAQTIADVEVIAVGDDTGNGAVLRALKVWKGLPKNTFDIQVRTSCDIGFWQKGNRLRLILTGGPMHFSASQISNGVLTDESTVFSRELDRLIGSNRPHDFRQPNMMYDR